MLKEIPLREFIAKRSQSEVAALMGVTQGAISQMLRSKRDIRVIEIDAASDKYRFVEVKPLGRISLNRI